ncbi:nitrate reductase molybdenum cofactor assembly chaperone [Bacillus niameyensis]|uniref:nitrate reductase molybdenum cofactor assembly chaperone n=1 Tax=Bacillus niameyensis TaxID=1522308 RepID=UPI00078047B0|nr:nitrate reductase molybdenum cofactor assembly chaperone [Bacillus niameyensis]
MIDLEKLYQHKDAFGFFAQMLSYPEKQYFHPAVLEESIDSSHPAYAHIKIFWDLIHEFNLDEMEEMYTATFDFQKNSALFMTYFKYEDGKERGQMLAKLKVMYEMYGLEMPAHELSDYLPLMCEFLYAAEWGGDPRSPQSFSILFAVLEDGTYHLLKSLEKDKSPYFHLVKGLRETLRTCVKQGETTHEHA